MEWNGIDNEHDFYSAYFFSESLKDTLQSRLSAWNSAEDEAKTKAETAGEKDWLRTPGHQLRLDARTLLDDMSDARAEADPDERIAAGRRIIARMMRALRIPMTKGGVDVIRPMGEDRLPLPLLSAVMKEGGSEPLLWVFEASDTASTEDGTDPAERDPLGMKLDLRQLGDDLPELPRRAKEDSVDDWGRIIERQVFGCDNPPRWVILASRDQWVLIDRTKYGRRAVLRFNWKELFTRREPQVLDVCGALLCVESMTSVNGSVLLDDVDESAHKEAYGVSESLKKSLREAIELLGNEAATQIVEKRRQAREAIWKDDKLASDLTVECLRYMYRILFLLFVESRKELHYAPVDNQAYQSAYSFESLRDLELVPLVTDEDRNGRFIHDSITKLVSFYAQGTATQGAGHLGGKGNFEASAFTIEPLKGTLFDMERTKLLNQVVFRNETLQKVIRLMSLSRSEGRGKRAARTGRISYAHLGINQLGAVYEALLSYRGFFAKDDLYEVHAAGESVDEFEAGYFVTASELEHYKDDEKTYVTTEEGEKQLKIYPKETFIYRLTGRDREKSASYYTPEVLTQCTVKYTLKEYKKTVLDPLPDDRARAEKILSVRICEPAMGSAAFLNEAINQLTVLYMGYAQKAKEERLSQDDYARELQRVKMFMADNCVYGVDLNPVAVELAEVSLWLNALSSDRFVPWFGLQLQAGNSLIGCRRRVYEASELLGKWTEVVPKDIGAKPLGKHQIWQFLVPNPGMADYADKDVKAVYKTEIDELNKRRKAFISRKFSVEDIQNMEFLSEKAERLWQSWAKKLADVRAKTTDPYDVYGHEAAKTGEVLSYAEKNALVEAVRRGDGSADSGEFMRLRMAMNYWCALWFWPIEEADKFPTREDFYEDMGTILSSELCETQGVDPSQGLFAEDEALRVSEDEHGRLRIEELVKLKPNLAISEKLAERYRFFHWPLRFADVFLPQDGREPGFDLTFGNPPWRVPSWNSGAVVGDFLPYVQLRGESASTIRTKLLEKDASGRTLIDRRPDLASAWRSEFEESMGVQAYLSNCATYPETKGGTVDLFKIFLPLSWSNASQFGFQGFVHPLTNLTDTNGLVLRRASYERLRFLAQFANELRLFAEVGHPVRFCVAVYGEFRKLPEFDLIMNLFHPKTVDDCFVCEDGEVSGIKAEDGSWNVKGCRERLIKMDAGGLAKIAAVFSDNPRSPLLPNIHSQSLLRVLEKYAVLPRRISDLGDGYVISRMWDETGARVDGTIKELPNLRTGIPCVGTPAILNGPHIHLANPFFKNPENPCRNPKSWLNIDLEILPEEFCPRTKYRQACGDVDYVSRQQEFPKGKPFDSNWRLFYRKMAPLDLERTLTGSIMPPRVGCVDALNALAAIEIDDLLVLAASFVSLPMDAYVKQLGKMNLHPALISSLPLLNYGDRKAEAHARALVLNCLTKPYAELWKECFNPSFAKLEWTQTVPGVSQAFWKQLSETWSRSTALRVDLSRRQALVELDVLTAQVMGFNLDELKTLYRQRFAVLRGYERDTWYDQKGRIIFSPNALGLRGVGLPRRAAAKDAKEGITYTVNGRPCDAKGLGFEDVKNMQSGFVTKTFMDASMTDEPVERTVKYVAPFFKMDRERDYDVAWAFFEEKYGKVDVAELQGVRPEPVEAEAEEQAEPAETSKKSRKGKKPELKLVEEPFNPQPSLFE